MPKKLTVEEVKKRIKNIHGDNVELKEDTYVNTHTKCEFVDLQYGSWWAKPNDVLGGHGHKKRGIKKRSDGQRLSMVQVKEKIKMVHGDLVFVKEETYIDTKTKCTFIDIEYGEWQAKPNSIFNGAGNPQRAIHKNRLLSITPVEEIKKALIEVHGGIVIIKEDTYCGAGSPCTFIDLEFGQWIAAPYYVLSGHGHFKRGILKRAASKKISIEKIKKRLLKIHGGIVSLKEESYVDTQTYCIFIDSEYGEWKADPRSIFAGQGHPTRGVKNRERTCMERYGVAHPAQSEEIQRKMRKTCLENFGVESSFQSEEVKQKIKERNLKKYGVEFPMQNSEISLKAARTLNISTVAKHWRTGDDLVCVAGYEKAVVEYFNLHRVNFEWQSRTFKMPDGRTYRPDCYLPDRNVWVEIKGYFRPLSWEKWNWFHWFMPNSELWNKKVLGNMNII